MTILGIDPGTQRIGYGLIRNDGKNIELLKAGILAIKNKDGVGALQEIKLQIEKIIKKFKPGILSIEKLFFMKNQKTAMRVAEARGVVMLAAAENGLKVLEYGPNEVKAGITGYGLADKKAVLKMVRFILSQPELDIIDDASDALALAIMASHAIPKHQ